VQTGSKLQAVPKLRSQEVNLRKSPITKASENQKQEKTKFWRDEGLELLRATYISHSFQPHSHDSFVVAMIERGTETFGHRHLRYFAPAGSLVVINPGEVHDGQAVNQETGWSYRVLYPTAEAFGQVASQIAGRQVRVPDFSTRVIQDGPLFREFLSLHLTLEETTFRLERDSRLLQALTRLISRYAQPQPEPKPLLKEKQAVRTIREYLEANYTENISLAALARQTNLSQFHLLRVFQQETGLPPHRYLTQLRIARAKTLLALGHRPAQVATEVGFADQSHLNRHFRGFVGITPGQYLA